MRIHHGQVKGSEEKVGVGKGNEHGTVGSGVTGVNHRVGLEGESRVGTSLGERRVGQVQLGNPGGELRSTGGGRSDIAIVGSNRRPWVLPLQVNLLAWEGKRFGAVAADGWITSVASNIDVLTTLVGWDS